MKTIRKGIFFVLLLLLMAVTLHSALAYNVWKEGKAVCVDCNERGSDRVAKVSNPAPTYHGNYPPYTTPHESAPSSYYAPYPSPSAGYGTPPYTIPSNLQRQLHDLPRYVYPRTVDRYYEYGDAQNPYIYKQVRDSVSYHSYEDMMHERRVPVWGYSV
ncbi:hypothetical protein COY95_03490 [Candidatus Woesearchaeota archaeon CG_4_10_14_0_8_um_filter_47_5]|nr:MAG: hypothetical protein COY95_03490 [Candidatus Woesearchaeota archaeon CG_4_10_14_0_8_um_filter_47_5]